MSVYNVMGPPEDLEAVLRAFPLARVVDRFQNDKGRSDVNVEVHTDLEDGFCEACEEKSLVCGLV